MSDHGPLSIERDSGVVLLTLDRPDDLNALNRSLVAALDDAIAAAEQDDAARVIVITGAGRAFCAGFDLKQVEEAAPDPPKMRADLVQLRGLLERIETLSMPVIAAVNGTAFAGGIELALACDVILASSKAKLGDVHAKFGLAPGGGGTARLPRAVGARNARWLMYTGDVIDAQEALRIQLVQAVFEADEFQSSVMDVARRLAAGSRATLSFMKRMSAEIPTDDELDRELDGIIEMLAGDDAREGVAAFVQGREPKFG